MDTLRCWACEGTGDYLRYRQCSKCSGTGRVFWVDGRAYPYTPEGEKAAKVARS